MGMAPKQFVSGHAKKFFVFLKKVLAFFSKVCYSIQAR